MHIHPRAIRSHFVCSAHVAEALRPQFLGTERAIQKGKDAYKQLLVDADLIFAIEAPLVQPVVEVNSARW